MAERIDISEMPRFKASEIDEAMRFVREGKGPAYICSDDGNDTVLSRFDQFMEGFGSLYSDEEIRSIKESCKNFRE